MKKLINILWDEVTNAYVDSEEVDAKLLEEILMRDNEITTEEFTAFLLGRWVGRRDK